MNHEVNPVDEIQVLQEWANAVPTPSQELTDRVRERVESAIRDGVDGRVAAVSHVRVGRNRWSAAGALAVAACVALVAILLAQSSPNPSPHLSQPSPEHWKLVGYVVQPGLTQSQTGPGGGLLTCPTTSTCYLADLSSKQSVLDASRDGGSHWAMTTLPQGLTLTTGLQCVSALQCYAGAIDQGSGTSIPSLLVTRNGGNSWSTRSISAASGVLYSLSCSSNQNCAGLMAANPLNPTASVFVNTSDGGAHWTGSSLPADAVEHSLTCVSFSDCLVGGDVPSSPGAPGTGTVLVTENAGSTWTPSSLPTGTASVTDVTCPTAQDCLAIASYLAQSLPSCAATPPRQPGTELCGSTPGALVTEPIASSDGGDSWQLRQLPSSVPEPQIFGISCPTATQCWLAGSQAIATKTNTENTVEEFGGSPLLVSTSNGGSDWSTVIVPTPQSAPNDDSVSTIGSIQCPNPTSCIALGATIQGARRSIVYSYGQ